MSSHQLRVIDPSGREMEYPIQGELSIGSDQQNHIVLSDPAVAPQHLTIGGDGASFWFRQSADASGTMVNGQPASEGWLSGGEQIQIGGYRIVFSAPEIAAPAEIMAPPELEGIGLKSMDMEDQLELAGSFLDQPYQAAPSTSGPRKKRSNVMIWNIFAISLYVVGGVVIAGGIFVFWQAFLSRPGTRAHREDARVRALTKTLEGKRLMALQKWQQAVLSLKEADTLTPRKSELRKVLNELVTLAGNEWDALSAYRKARGLHFRLKKSDDALALLKKIPKDRRIYPKAKQTYDQIYKAHISSLLSRTRASLAIKNLPSAQETLRWLLKYEPKRADVLALQTQYERLEEATPEGRRRIRIALSKFPRGVDMFKSGRPQAALSFFRKFTAKGNPSAVRRRARTYVTSILSFKTVLAKGRAALRSGSYQQAVSLLSRARSMDSSLGGGNRSKYMGRLAKAYYKLGNAAYSRKKYSQAMRNYSRSNSLSPNGSAQAGMNKVKRKCASLITQAVSLKGVDDSEANRTLREVMRILPRSHPLHRKARRLLK